MASTVAASNADAMLVKAGQAPLSVQELVTGYRSAFIAAAAIAVLALLVALTLLGPRRGPASPSTCTASHLNS